MRKTSTVLALGACSLALTGCQAVFGTSSFASQAPSVDAASLDMSDYFTARLEAGRIHLAQGRPAAAVTAFRQASYNAAHAGPAYNGMGVAYAQMGRHDLARRYFEMAVAADSGDQRFARNLARLDDKTLSDSGQPQLADSSQPPSQVSALSGSIEQAPAQHVASSRPGLVRVSSREMQIVSPTGAQQPAQAARPERPVIVAQSSAGRAYPIRIELPEAASTRRPDYPVRIALSDVKVVQRPSYPIRIELPDAH